MSRQSARLRVIAASVLITSLFSLAAVCGDDRPSAETRERERILLDDPVRQLKVRGGVFRGEGSTAGSPADSPSDPVTVNRNWLFEGEVLEVGAPVARQLHEFGWTVTGGSCSEKAVVIRAKKQFDGFVASLESLVQIRPSGEREVNLEITAPYPGKEPTGSFPIRPQVPHASACRRDDAWEAAVAPRSETREGCRLVCACDRPGQDDHRPRVTPTSSAGSDEEQTCFKLSGWHEEEHAQLLDGLPQRSHPLRHYSLVDDGRSYDVRLTFQQTAPDPSPETTVDVVIELVDPFPPEPATSATTGRDTRRS